MPACLGAFLAQLPDVHPVLAFLLPVGAPVCVPWEWLLPPVLSPEGKVGAAASVAEVTSVAEV